MAARALIEETHVLLAHVPTKLAPRARPSGCRLMYASAVTANRFRNLDCTVPLCSPLTVLVGENNVGKSNVIDALRLVLEPDVGPRGRRWIREDDFAHDGAGKRIADDFEIAVDFHGLNDEDKARLVTCLAPSRGEDAARLRIRARLGTSGRADIEWFGGDSEHPDVERWARTATSYTYLHPLRDAAADLRPGRDNRLVGLLRALAPDGGSERAEIEELVANANADLRAKPSIAKAETGIAARLRGMTGGGPFAQKTKLDFDPPVFERIVANLRAWVGHIEPLEMTQNGLGYNNLLYIAVLLAALEDPGDESLHVLLVEEPEAHLHPQLQDLLMRYLESLSSATQQVIVTSHSPHFASAARVERVTVLSRPSAISPVTARAPREFGLDKKQLDHLRRFLDVTKSALFFARGVILVEGVAEQLLVPAIARWLKRPLPDAGVSVIGIGGVAFPPFAGLFGDERLPYRLAIVSDADAQPSEDEVEGADPKLSPRAEKLLGSVDERVAVKLSQRTLEWDLVKAGNWDLMLDALEKVKPVVAKRLREEAASLSVDEQADRMLDALAKVKGQFAQELADLIDAAVTARGEAGEEAEPKFVVPPYLAEAIGWVTPEL